MKRHLLFFSCGAVSALVLANMTDRVPAGALIILFIISAVLIPRRSTADRICLCLALGALCSLTAYNAHCALFVEPVSGLYDNRCEVSGYILSDVDVGDRYSTFTVAAERIVCGETVVERPLKINVSYYGGDSPVPRTLDRITFSAIIRRHYEAPYDGAFSAFDYYRSKGIFMHANVSEGRLEASGRVFRPLTLFGHAVRTRIKAAAQGLRSPAVSLVCAVLTSDKDLMPYSLRDVFSRAGVSHIMAVSGMHISIAAGFLLAILTFLGVGRRKKWLLVSLLCVLYMSVASFSPSVTRAGLMFILMAAGVFADRDYDILTSLAFSACAILLFNPFSVFDPSFVLSFAATAGIVILLPGMLRLMHAEPRHEDRLLRRAWCAASSVVGVSLSAFIFTLPFVAGFFRCVPLLGVVSNLLIVPILPFFFGLCAAFAALCGIPAAAAVLGPACCAAADYIIGVCTFISGLPFCSLDIFDNRGIILCAVTAAAAALFVVLAAKHIRLAGAAALSAVCVCLLTLFLFPAEKVGENEMVVSFIDVGQGDCTYIDTCGRDMLIDCGSTSIGAGSGERAAEYIRRRDDDVLDVVAVTHFHADHCNGVKYIIENMQVGELIVPPFDGSEMYSEILEAARLRGIPVTMANDDLTVALSGPVTAEVMTRHLKEQTYDENERNIVYMVRCGSGSVFVTGDIEQDAEKRLVGLYPLSADVLKVPHHGSNTSSCDELLNAVSPLVCVVSCGAHNSYGHPHSEVVGRIEALGAELIRTDISHTVDVTVNADGAVTH